MPFTFVHPVFVLPFVKLSKKWVSVTGLIAGSMAPDFEYFIRAQAKGNYGHTISGVFWFDLPLALLLVFLFHNLVRNPLILHLPLFLKKHLATYTAFNWNLHFKKYWLVVIVSILVGTATHILADAFTHFDGYFVHIFPVLESRIQVAGLDVPVYKLLQHGFTPVGGLILLAAVLFLPAASVNAVTASAKLKYWAIVGGSTLVFLALALLFWLKLESNAFGHIVVATISGGLLGLILASLLSGKRQTR